MEGEPDGNGEKDNGDEIGECPREEMRLDGENGDHEIIGKASMAEEASVFGETLAQAAEKRGQTEGKNEEGDDDVDGFEGTVGFPIGNKIGVNPLRNSPKKTETSLDGGAEICF